MTETYESGLPTVDVIVEATDDYLIRRGDKLHRTTLAQFETSTFANNVIGEIYVSGNAATEGSVRLIKETVDPIELQELLSGVWNPSSLRLSSDTLDLGHGVSISGVGDHVRYSTADEALKFLVLGVPFDDTGTGAPETVVLGTRVDDDPVQEVSDTELTSATEHTFSRTFTTGTFIYTLHFLMGPIGATADVTLTISEGLTDGGSIHFTRNYAAGTFPADGTVDLDMLAGISFHTGDEGFFKLESTVAFNLLGNSSGDMFVAFDQQPKSTEDMVSLPTGTDRFVVANGDVVTSDGNIVYVGAS